jgi:hypothetical protein
MLQWQYKIQSLKAGVGDELLQEFLTDQGKDAWELVSVISMYAPDVGEEGPVIQTPRGPARPRKVGMEPIIRLVFKKPV